MEQPAEMTCYIFQKSSALCRVTNIWKYLLPKVKSDEDLNDFRLKRWLVLKLKWFVKWEVIFWICFSSRAGSRCCCSTSCDTKWCRSFSWIFHLPLIQHHICWEMWILTWCCDFFIVTPLLVRGTLQVWRESWRQNCFYSQTSRSFLHVLHSQYE